MKKLKIGPGYITFNFNNGSFKILENGSLEFSANANKQKLAEEFADYMTPVNKAGIHIDFNNGIKFIFQKDISKITFEGFLPSDDDKIFWQMIIDLWENIAVICKSCGITNEYAKSNQSDGSYICYNCRS